MSGEERVDRQYVNRGAPFWSGSRETGMAVRKGDVFYPTHEDLSRRREKLRPVDDGPVDSSQRPIKGGTPRSGTSPGAVAPGKWPGFRAVDFASDAAYELAKSLELGDLAFEGAQGTGHDGTWRIEDVRKLVGEPEPATEIKTGEQLMDGIATDGAADEVKA